MTKTAKYYMPRTIAVLALVTVCGVFKAEIRDIPRMIMGSEGRYSDIKWMRKVFESKPLKLPGSGYKHTYPDGSWAALLATDSHHGGGTVGVLKSNGEMHFYFGHNCGLGEGVGIYLGETEFNENQRNNHYEKITDY